MNRRVENGEGERDERGTQMGERGQKEGEERRWDRKRQKKVNNYSLSSFICGLKGLICLL